MIVPQRPQLDLALNRANSLCFVKTLAFQPSLAVANAVTANLIQTISVSIRH